MLQGPPPPGDAPGVVLHEGSPAGGAHSSVPLAELQLCPCFFSWINRIRTKGGVLHTKGGSGGSELMGWEPLSCCTGPSSPSRLLISHCHRHLGGGGGGLPCSKAHSQSCSLQQHSHFVMLQYNWGRFITPDFRPGCCGSTVQAWSGFRIYGLGFNEPCKPTYNPRSPPMPPLPTHHMATHGA